MYSCPARRPLVRPTLDPVRRARPLSLALRRRAQERVWGGGLAVCGVAAGKLDEPRRSRGAGAVPSAQSRGAGVSQLKTCQAARPVPLISADSA